MQAEQSIAVDSKSPGGINWPHGLILFDGVCVLCSRGCRFVSKRDRRDDFRFVPIQLPSPLAEQARHHFALVPTGQAYVKSEAVLRIARELPRWQWIWIRLHPAEFGSFVPIANRPAAISTGALRRAHDDRPSSDHHSCRRHDYQNFITLGATQDFFLPRRLDYSA